MEEELKQYPLWKEAVNKFLAMNPQPGTVLTEKWKQENFGIHLPKNATLDDLKEYQFSMLSSFDNFRQTLLEEHQIHLKANKAGSHIMLAPREQAGAALKDFNTDIKRAVVKSKRRIENVAVEQLTNEERKEVTDAQVRVAMAASMFKQVKKLKLPQAAQIT